MSQFISIRNSRYTALGLNDTTFTGETEEIGEFPTIVVSCLSDCLGELYVDQSVDAINWDSSLPCKIVANKNEAHRFVILKAYYRVRFIKASGTAQSILRLQTKFGNFPSLTSLLNSQIQSDADTLVVRPLDFNLMVSEGLYENRVINIKDGINLDIDTGTLPEDIWDEGGVYTGFPTGTPEEGQIVVAGADTGTVYYAYLSSSNDTDYSFGSKAIAGSGNYDLGHNVWRCNFMYFVANSATAFNVGKITLRNKVTTANVFCTIPVGYSQSFCGAYTVPANSEIYIDRFNGNLRGSSTGSVDGYVWYRPLGESPRLRFPFELTFGTLFFDDVDYCIRIPEKVDFIPRITSASANNLVVKYSYRLLRVLR